MPGKSSKIVPVIIGAMVSVAVAGVTVPALADGIAPEGSRSTDGATPSRLDLAPELEAVVASIEGPASWQERRIVATADDGAELGPGEYADARVWQAEFAGDKNRGLDVVVTKNPVATESSVVADCAAFRTDWNFATCAVATEGQDIVRYVERAAQRVPGGWPIVMNDGLNDLQGDLFQLQQVVVYRPDGLTVQVTEVAKNVSLRLAREAWTLSPEALVDIATDSRLTEARIDRPADAS